MQIIKVPGLNNKGKNNSCRNAGNAIISALDEIWSSEKVDSDEEESAI